ncbi:hypothetical protein AAG906_000210 [Vitis piasezkii]
MAFETFVQPVIPRFNGVAEPTTGTTLNDKQKSEIEGKETSKDIWDSMKKKYQSSTRVKRAQLQALKRDFETLQMKDGESVTSYYARTMDISNKM